MKNPNVSVQPMAGRQLPADWMRTAATRKSQAEADYIARIENAWKVGGSHNAMQDARLTNDSRIDGLMKVSEDDEEEVWASAGVTVRRRKK